MKPTSLLIALAFFFLQARVGALSARGCPPGYAALDAPKKLFANPLKMCAVADLREQFDMTVIPKMPR